tara:strand:+ start:518 stop:742 length:225 start_codon:yes stop_codon:yes gene_type:complete
MSLSTESYQSFIDVIHEDLIKTRGQRDELLAALGEIKVLIAAPFDGRSNSSADRVRAINDLCIEAIAKTEGGEE